MARKKKEVEEMAVGVTETPVEVAVKEILTEEEKVEETPSKPLKMGEVTVSLLNIRTGEGKDTPVLLQITKGKPVEILENSGEWLKVKVGGKVGFAMAKYIR